MALLRYRALTPGGAREAGVVDAATPAAAMATLRARGLVVLDVSLAEAPTGFFGGRIRSGDLAEFTEGSPVPLDHAVDHYCPPVSTALCR